MKLSVFLCTYLPSACLLFCPNLLWFLRVFFYCWILRLIFWLILYPIILPKFLISSGIFFCFYLFFRFFEILYVDSHVIWDINSIISSFPICVSIFSLSYCHHKISSTVLNTVLRVDIFVLFSVLKENILLGH